MFTHPNEQEEHERAVLRKRGIATPEPKYSLLHIVILSTILLAAIGLLYFM